MTADEALSRARIQLMTKADSVFFTNVCFSLKQSFDESIPTACASNTKIRFNPEFFLNLDKEERIGLMLHETLHCAYMHPDRLENRDHRIFNIAADHVINLQLLERGYKLPKNGYADRQYKGMNVEQVYDLLMASPPPNKPEYELDLDPNGGDEVERQAAAAEIEDILIRAALQSKMSDDKPGTIPGDIEIFLNKLLNPKLPWYRILQKYLQSFAQDDYSYSRPNRRYIPSHFLPTLKSQSLIDIAVSVDTSGSVSDEEFTQFISETAFIMKLLKPKTITVIQFDTEIKSIDKVKNMKDLMDVEFTGRGGTKIQPVIEWANANKPSLMLVFTDGEFNLNKDDKSKVPFVWLIHRNKTFNEPFGKTIFYDLE